MGAMCVYGIVYMDVQFNNRSMFMLLIHEVDGSLFSKW